MRIQPKLSVWQWNCRGIGRKTAGLSLLAAQAAEPPAVITLQELGKCTNVRIKGYDTHYADQYVAVLVHNKYPVEVQEPLITGIPHVYVTLISSGRTNKTPCAVCV